MATKEEIGSLLDALYLELFNLIEQHTACRVNIERTSNGGQLLLAKTRYVQGSNTVSAAQIPTENSADFKALCRVEEKSNDERLAGVEYILNRRTANKDEGYVEPLHWFGVLAPSSLRAAAEQFKKCIELAVESANLQREVFATVNNIERLKKVMAEKFEESS